MLKRITPNIIVEDVSRTIKFYTDIIACFELVDYDSKKGKFSWALLRCGDTQIMFESRESIAKSIPALEHSNKNGAITIYVELDGIKELYKMIKDKVDIVKDLHNAEYGMREFSIQDCNGFIITFAEWVGVKGFLEDNVYHKELTH